MASKQLNQCRTGKDFISYAEKHGGDVTHCTNGVKIRGPKPGIAIIHSNHPKELATGTRSALIKALIAIGLGAFLALAVIAQYALAMN